MLAYTIIGLVIAFLIFAWGVTFYTRIRLSVVQITLFFLSVQYIAVLRYCLENNTFEPVWYFSSAMFLFPISLVLTISFNKRYDHVTTEAFNYSLYPKTDFYLLACFASLSLFFVLYHYIVGGIPLLSDRVEVDRFEATTSGLLGIPGRITKFGIIFTLFLFIAYSQLVYNRHKPSRYLELFWIAVVGFSLILTGFKSSLIVLLEAIIIANAYYPRWRIKEKFKKKTIALYLTISMAFAFLVAALYSFNREVQYDVATFIIDRIFYLSGWPFSHAVTEFVPVHGYGLGEHFLRDIKYVLNILHIDGSQTYNTVQLISADMHGRKVGVDFNVPVTLNFFGQSFLDFGLLGICISAIVSGSFLGYIYVIAYREKRIIYRAFLYFIQLATFTAITKGNLIYEIADRGFTIVVMLLMLIFSIILIKKQGAKKSCFSYLRYG